jgi:hypothetical protein
MLPSTSTLVVKTQRLLVPTLTKHVELLAQITLLEKETQHQIGLIVLLLLQHVVLLSRRTEHVLLLERNVKLVLQHPSITISMVQMIKNVRKRLKTFVKLDLIKN